MREANPFYSTGLHVREIKSIGRSGSHNAQLQSLRALWLRYQSIVLLFAREQYNEAYNRFSVTLIIIAREPAIASRRLFRRDR